MSFTHRPQFPQEPSPEEQSEQQPAKHSVLASNEAFPQASQAYRSRPHYEPKGFSEIYHEAVHLRQRSGKVAVAFVMTFLVLYVAGNYAEVVESTRLNPENWNALTDSAKFGSQYIYASREATEAPGFIERFGLKTLAALGSIGFFLFAAAAVAEISFRTYENRESESYEVLDSLTKTHGNKLLILGVFFLFLLLCVAAVDIALTLGKKAQLPWYSIVILFAQYYLLMRTVFAVHSMIGEGLGVRESLQRSWDLTMDNNLRLMWWGFLFAVIMFLTILLYLVPMMFVAVFIAALFSGSDELMVEVVGIIMLFAIPLLAKPVSLVFYFQMALYRELRLRHDGIDEEYEHIQLASS
jgi:hypothetical protein